MGSNQGINEKRVVAFRLKFSGRSARELGEAYEWYETQSQGGLGPGDLRTRLDSTVKSAGDKC
jgi:hypothetical protein